MAMDKSAPPGYNLPWAGKKVRPDQVEEELTFLWHLAADNMRISQNMNVRTSVLNFVICAPDTQSAYQASSLLRDLASTHIARVTLLILDTRSDLPSEMSSWVTLRSFPIISDIMRHHFEQITVTLTGGAVTSAASALQSLLKPDLPVYLWWLNDLPTDNTIFHRLINISSRVIVDSRDFSSPEESIRTLSALLQEAPDCALSDLNWGRLTPWRELVAQFFDVAEYRPYLASVDRIEIEHAVAPFDGSARTQQDPVSPNPIRALLLAAWLKTRLGWQLSSDDEPVYHDVRTGTHSWHMTSRATSAAMTGPLSASRGGKAGSTTRGSIDISIRPRVQSELQPGNLCLVRLTSSIDGKQAVFSIDRGDDDDHALTSVELPDNTRPPRIVNMATKHKETELLHDELEIMGRDHIYEEALHEVFALLS